MKRCLPAPRIKESPGWVKKLEANRPAPAGSLRRDDQTTSDADQTASDSDQTRSDSDQAGSDSDQVGSDADQLAADRDQEMADRLLEGASQPSDMSDLDRSRSERETARKDRATASSERAVTSMGRDRQAAARDESARQRDLQAERRDRWDAARARQAVTVVDQAESDGTRTRAAMAAAAAARGGAALARARAAEDRKRAALDREQAAADRVQAAIELERAHLDELTGAYRRGLGMTAMSQEVDRVSRRNENLVLAYVDVDGLKGINDGSGHEAGDDVLRMVGTAIRDNLRSYDPFVRMGGDEFVCLFSETSLDDASVRFTKIGERLGRESKASISVGLVELRPGETLDELLSRGDAAMYADKALN